MIRYGIIVSLNRVAKIGFIRDVNKQKIKFHLESSNTKFNRTDLVSYEIAMIETELVAINLTLIIAKFGEIFKFKLYPK